MNVLDDMTSEWKRYPETEAYLAEKLTQFVDAVPPARALDVDLSVRTSSRLSDWLDHLVLVDGDAPRARLVEYGFVPQAAPALSNDRVYHHPGALFPRVVLRGQEGVTPGTVLAVALQVEEVSAFLMAHEMDASIQLVGSIEGAPLSPLRRACVYRGAGQEERELWVVERRGGNGFVPVEVPPDYARRYLHAFERWAIRKRGYVDPRQGMTEALQLARSLASEMGTDTAAWIVFAAERTLWQRRNKAGQVQKARQDSLGLGWANHDHHTFRSSRETFGTLLQILEALGFHPRERFYAGAEAGWGAQVMEQPVCRIVVFADVDLAPDELTRDFHDPLAPRQELGTVGLWCALHGESMLTAGLHHLAGRFDFEAATAGLAEWGIKMMRPFSDFDYLHQAFTRAERWAVPPERLARLVAAGHIDREASARFAQVTAGGAIGSHLENIQRGQGFKGFNQQTVSDIIRRTDPRTGYGAA